MAYLNESSWQDIEAITTFIEDQRSKIPQFPALQSAIEDYERWLGGLNWYDKNIGIDAKFREAKWHRDHVNEIMGQKLPADQTSGDASTAALNPSTKPSILPTIPFKYKLAAAGVGAGVVLFYVGKAYVKAVMPPIPKFRGTP